MGIELKELKLWFGDTYNITGNFVLGIDHDTVRESRFAEQMLLPLLPPMFVQLSNEGGWDPF
jgi:hypothetical protein